MLSKLLQDELHYSSGSKAKGTHQHLRGNSGSVTEQEMEDVSQLDYQLHVQKEKRSYVHLDFI